MAQQPRLGTILGEYGEPISRPADSLADLNLPPGVQALVETRVNAAVEQLREDNRREIKDLVRKNTRKWQVIAAISVLFTLGSWFVAPQQIRKWARDYVQKRMTAPELKKAADQAIATQMSDYVRAQIDPVKKDISAKQEQLQSAQITINDQVRVQQLAIGAKAGGLADYEELQRDAARTDELGNTAKTSLKEIELYFDADRAQLTFPVFADSVLRRTRAGRMRK